MRQHRTSESTDKEWHLGYVMPNLLSCRPFKFDFEDILIVSGDSPLLAQIMRDSPAARALLSGFGQCLGTKLPAALIYRRTGQLEISKNAIVDARNCVAVACSCYGWAQSIGYSNNFTVRHTDHFDFYPRWSSKDEKHLEYRGPALDLRTTEAVNFHGTTHPYLSVNCIVQPDYDENLLRNLQQAWQRTHVTKQPTDYDSKLFRSLSVAYEACRVPHAMDNPLYDHGKHCSLWVSAFETLAHKGKKSGFEQVVKLIGQKKLFDSQLSREKQIKLCEKIYNLNAAQRMYWQIHLARNAFLHGNPLSIDTFIPSGLAASIRLLDVAPLVFHTALEAFFVAPESHAATSAGNADIDSVFRTNPLEEGYLRALNLGSTNDDQQ